MTALRRVAAALLLSATAAQAQPAAVPPGILACDRAAAAPHDPTRPEGVPGVLFDRLDPADAPVCEQAGREAPDIARLPFQLARLRERVGQEAEAVALYREAARLGHVAAMLRLARMDAAGFPAEAIRLLRQAAEGGSDPALIGPAELLALGAPGIPPDEAEALRLLRRAAQGGTPEALFAFGRLRMGDHQPLFGQRDSLVTDQIEGARLFRLAAERGYAPAQSRLALLHQHGLAVNGQVVVTEDEAEALRLYRLAAEGGDLFALNSIGVFHEQGRGGLARDDAAALRHYRETAARGDDVAMFNLGRFSLEGRGGLAPDREAGIGWHRQAARAGNPGSQLALRRLGLDW